MRWPWKTEKRDTDYSDAFVRALLGRAQGATPIVASATGAFEAGAGLISRAFASAEVETDGDSALITPLTPEFLSMLARAIIGRGEFVAYMQVRGGRVELTPCAAWDVDGSYDRTTWRYRLDLSGPSGQASVEQVRPENVLHARYAVAPTSPWRGIAPLQSAALAGRLSAEVVAALADETSGPRGALLPLPVPGDDPTVAALKGDIRNLKGSIALVEGQGRMSASTGGDRREWQSVRLGANPPAAMVELAGMAAREVLGVLGIPPVLLAENPNGTAAREAWRQLLFSTVAPLGRIVAHELSTLLGAPIRFGWAEIACRRRGWAGTGVSKSMVGAGMDR